MVKVLTGRARALGERGDERTVDPARKKGADRDIGHELPRDGGAERLVERRERLGLVDDRVRRARQQLRAMIEPAFERDAADRLARRGRRRQRLGGGGERHAQDRPRRQFVDAREDREWRGHISARHQRGERARLDRIVEARQRPQRRERRGEGEPRRRPAIVKRLLAEAIARERQRARLAIP